MKVRKTKNPGNFSYLKFPGLLKWRGGVDELRTALAIEDFSFDVDRLAEIAHKPAWSL